MCSFYLYACLTELKIGAVKKFFTGAINQSWDCFGMESAQFECFQNRILQLNVWPLCGEKGLVPVQNPEPLWSRQASTLPMQYLYLVIWTWHPSLSPPSLHSSLLFPSSQFLWKVYWVFCSLLDQERRDKAVSWPPIGSSRPLTWWYAWNVSLLSAHSRPARLQVGTGLKARRLNASLFSATKFNLYASNSNLNKSEKAELSLPNTHSH